MKPHFPFSPPTSIRGFNQTLSSLIRNYDPKVLSLFSHSIRTKGINCDKYTYSMVIKYCAETNRLDLAFAFLGRLLKEGIRADSAIFNPLLKGLCSLDRICEAVGIMTDKMPKMGCTPDVISYNIFTKSLCSKSNTRLALQLFFQMVKHGGEKKPSVYTYNTILNELCNGNEIVKASSLYNQMKLSGVLPNTVTYNTLFKLHCKNGVMEDAMVLLDYMICHGTEPDVVTYSTLINGSCKNSEIFRAKELLRDMISKGLEPDLVTYNTLIDGLYKHDKPGMANQVLCKLISKGLELNIVSYASIINWLCKRGDIKGAENY